MICRMMFGGFIQGSRDPGLSHFQPQVLFYQVEPAAQYTISDRFNTFVTVR